VIFGVMSCRLTAALIPVAMLARFEEDFRCVQAHYGGQIAPHFWWLVGAEFALATLAGVASRAIGYFDSLLADRFTRHVSIMVMDHASRIDLASYEDPASMTSWNGHECRPPIEGPNHRDASWESQPAGLTGLPSRNVSRTCLEELYLTGVTRLIELQY
jgi:hypothetical protein